MSDCVFCKIVANELPSYTIYEDNDLRVFLDVNPVADGHLLVIPKAHHENIFETPDALLEKILVVCKKFAILIKERLNATGVNIVNASGKDAQQTVFHIHFHIIPRYANDGKNFGFHGISTNAKNIANVYELLK